MGPDVLRSLPPHLFAEAVQARHGGGSGSGSGSGMYPPPGAGRGSGLRMMPYDALSGTARMMPSGLIIPAPGGASVIGPAARIIMPNHPVSRAGPPGLRASDLMFMAAGGRGGPLGQMGQIQFQMLRDMAGVRAGPQSPSSPQQAGAVEKSDAAAPEDPYASDRLGSPMIPLRHLIILVRPLYVEHYPLVAMNTLMRIYDHLCSYRASRRAIFSILMVILTPWCFVLGGSSAQPPQSQRKRRFKRQSGVVDISDVRVRPPALVHEYRSFSRTHVIRRDCRRGFCLFAPTTSPCPPCGPVLNPPASPHRLPSRPARARP
jgi:hypothetical protein